MHQKPVTTSFNYKFNNINEKKRQINKYWKQFYVKYKMCNKRVEQNV